MAKRIFEDQSLVKKASYLKLSAFKLAEGMKSGIFSSKFMGQGIEFSRVRDYNIGDDIRSIDWNVTARMGKPYVKLFEEERELQILIILDASSSMQIEDSKRSKYDQAKEAAALIAIAGELNSCPTGAVIFDEEILFASSPIFSKEQTLRLLKKMDESEKVSKEKKGSALASALIASQKLIKNRSLVFVISDFRAEDWQKPIFCLAQKNDVIAMRLQADYDEALPAIGTVIFEDAESQLKMELPSSSLSLKKEWEDYNKAQLTLWQTYCNKHSILPVILKTEDDATEVLNLIFSQRK